MTAAAKRRPGRPRKTESQIPFDDALGVAEEPVFDTPPATMASTVKATGVVRVSQEEVQEEERIRVWMGTVDECPYWTIHAGGADFPRFNEIVEKDPDGGHTRRERHRGKVLDLSRTEIELIARAVGKKVIRKNGARSFILSTQSERYNPSTADRPLGEYVYMQVLSDSMSPTWRNSDPETMV